MTKPPGSILNGLMFVALFSAASFQAQAATTTDVTFTVPVQIQNIHSDWQKVAVMCHGFAGAGGGNHPELAVEVGEIDVSGKSGGSVNQTVSGTIPISSAAERWECFLFIQHQGDARPVFPRNRGELKTTNGTITSGNF